MQSIRNMSVNNTMHNKIGTIDSYSIQGSLLCINFHLKSMNKSNSFAKKYKMFNFINRYNSQFYKNTYYSMKNLI